MPWISKNMSQPLTEGYYKCLIDSDGFSTLVESDNNRFDGVGWDLYESNCQFISYWWATKEEYHTIFEKLYKEMNETVTNPSYDLDRSNSRVNNI